MLELVRFRRALANVEWLPARSARGFVVTACCTLAGCGPTLSTVHVRSASSKLEEARSLGAEELAPYEYWMAKSYLEEARTETAEADYGDAVDLAEDSQRYSEQAISLIRGARSMPSPPPRRSGP